MRFLFEQTRLFLPTLEGMCAFRTRTPDALEPVLALHAPLLYGGSSLGQTMYDLNEPPTLT